MRPFWVDTIMEVFSWKSEMVLGNSVSSQVRSSSMEADFWPVVRLIIGGSRWMIVGK